MFYTVCQQRITHFHSSVEIHRFIFRAKNKFLNEGEETVLFKEYVLGMSTHDENGLMSAEIVYEEEFIQCIKFCFNK